MSTSSLRREGPDENRDIIVHYILVHEVPGGLKRDTWTVWLGKDKQVECASLEEATERARRLAREHGRRAWLHDTTGYPLKRIDA